MTPPVEVTAPVAPPTRAATASAKQPAAGRPARPTVAVRTETTPEAAVDTSGSSRSAAAGTMPVAREPAGTATAAGPDLARGTEAAPGAATTHGAPGPTPGPSGPPTLSVVPAHRSAPADADTHDATGADDAADDNDADEAPDVVEKVPTPVTPRPAARRAAGGRASVPVWADVLLGTAPVRPTSRDEQEPSRD